MIDKNQPWNQLGDDVIDLANTTTKSVLEDYQLYYSEHKKMILQFLHDEHLIPARGSGIHLGSVNLSGAHLIGANLTGANMPYADLSGVANLAQEQINVAKGDENTKLQGLQRPGSWKNT